ncbi:hypothetical protein [Paenibacillus polymyxa]|uniref:hypothetical protein n=1 Tax=Paenibacillus polymyxa TaxID=1406 RepID=UPI0004DF10A0|nr:hypothetical protein [Paenibacillus polymyxa]RPE03299.1 hypothetical protein EG487_14765 [Paenibacillus polymyxa]
MANSQYSKQIVESLLTYLPETATTLNRINELIQNVNLIEEGGANQDFREILNNMENVIALITPLVKLPADMNLGPEDVELYTTYQLIAAILLEGLGNLLHWIRDKGKNEDDLKNAIDLLFKASQRITELVEILID